MKQLAPGNFFGQINQTKKLGGIISTDTGYTHDYVDWHYHENAYFTFILEGKIIEQSKNQTYQCTAGSLLFHNWQEAHCNIKPKGFTRGFHIELNNKWLTDFDIDISKLGGSINICNPGIKILLHQIFKETKVMDNVSAVSIQQLLLQVFYQLLYDDKNFTNKNPLWVNKLKEILHDDLVQTLSLDHLAGLLNIHPVHLSRDFIKYFNCNLGEYIRRIRIERSLSLLPNRELSLTDIAFTCGFFDQSHFLRWFKQFNGITPSAYRKIIYKN